MESCPFTLVLDSNLSSITDHKYSHYKTIKYVRIKFIFEKKNKNVVIQAQILL